MVSGISTSQIESNSVNVFWEPEKSQCIRKKYLVEYQLTNLDQCNDQTGDTLLPAGTVATPNKYLEGLEPYSTYKIYVRTVLSDTYSGQSSSRTFVTGSTGDMYFNFQVYTKNF